MDKSINMSMAHAKGGFSFFMMLSKIQKNLIIAIPIAMVIGLVIGHYFEVGFLRQWVMPATFFMVYPMMVTLNIKQLFAKGGTRLLTTTQLLNFIVIPLLGFGIGYLFFKENLNVRIGLLLITLIPTSGMTITWTGIAKGNMNEAIRMTVSGLILGAILTPVYLKMFLGTAVSIPVTKILMQILLVVFVPMVLGFLTQRTLVKSYGQEAFKTKIKMKFPPLSTLGVLFIVFIAMALKSKSIMAKPEVILGMVIPLVLLYISIFFIATLLAKFWFKPADGIALVYGSAMRNLSIALAIAMSVFKESGSEIALIIALAYIIQVQLAVWYLKYTGKIFKIKS